MTTEDALHVQANAEAATAPPPQDAGARPAVPRWRRIACNPILRILIFIALAAVFSLLARWLTGTSRPSM